MPYSDQVLMLIITVVVGQGPFVGTAGGVAATQTSQVVQMATCQAAKKDIEHARWKFAEVKSTVACLPIPTR